MKTYLDLTKFGIALFSIIGGLAGYSLSLPVGQPIDLWQAVVLSLGIYFVSSGSFSLNQAQEWRLDQKMPRTEKRPVARGAVAPWQAYVLGFALCLFGLFLLFILAPLSAGLALLTVILYNGFYTLVAKRRWAFAAVPGAIPGAMPVVIGYAANSFYIFSAESVYLFMIMFLWQMPHFWSLSIRFKDDYAKGGVPVLPTVIGDSRTLYHIGLYLIIYVALALSSPLFLKTHIFYLLLVLPLCVKLLFEFYKYFHGNRNKSWLSFFLWTNLSVLIFMLVPIFDKWIYYLM